MMAAMPDPESIVIVGASLAAQSSRGLRDLGYDGPVVLIGDEPELPYERPPLSKGLGQAERDSVYVHEQSWYDDHAVELRLGVAVTALDRAAHEVVLDDRTRLRHGKLLLATGSRPRPLPVPGGDLDGVLALRRLPDSDRIKQAFADSTRVVIIGAGWIGLETAAAARLAGDDVMIVEQVELPLLVLGPEMGQVFADLHREHGVDLRLGGGIEEISGRDGRIDAVRLQDGTRLPADVVIAGVGIAPAVELAQDAGLGWRTASWTSTAQQRSGHLRRGRRRQRLPPVLRPAPAGRALGQRAQPAGGGGRRPDQDATYDRLPYFYTDQYDLGMEYVGFAEPDGYDQVVVRGDVADASSWRSGSAAVGCWPG